MSARCVGYMNDIDGKGEDQPIGRVSRLESSKGDGIMDKATVFVDKLLMPRSRHRVRRRRDRGGTAEPRSGITTPTATGWRTRRRSSRTISARKGGQPEHMANSLTFCMDNWLWGAGYGQRLRFVKGKFIGEPDPQRRPVGPDAGRLGPALLQLQQRFPAHRSAAAVGLCAQSEPGGQARAELAGHEGPATWPRRCRRPA